MGLGGTQGLTVASPSSFGLGWEGKMFGLRSMSYLEKKKSDYNVLYCCVEKVLCMHIFNKEFRVLRNKKEKVTHGSLVVRSHDLFTRLIIQKTQRYPRLCAGSADLAKHQSRCPMENSGLLIFVLKKKDFVFIFKCL